MARKKIETQEEVLEYIPADTEKRKHVVIAIAPTYIILQRPEGDNTWMPLNDYPNVKVGDIIYLQGGIAECNMESLENRIYNLERDMTEVKVSQGQIFELTKQANDIHARLLNTLDKLAPIPNSPVPTNEELSSSFFSSAILISFSVNR